MIFEGNKIWLFVNELTSYGISINYIKKSLSICRSGNSSAWKCKSHQEDKRIKLIDYDSLPETTKAKLPSRADLVKLSQANTTEAQLDIYDEACASLEELHRNNCFISDYLFFVNKMYDQKDSQIKAEDLKQAAGWLRLLNAYRTPKETRLINFNTKALLRKAVVEKLISDMKANRGKNLYGFKITNVAVLQRKELEWASAYEVEFENLKGESKIERERKANEAALSTLIHENIGNSNRRVLGRLNDNEAERILLPSGTIDFSEWNARTLVYLFTNPGKANKYDFENIERRYKHECTKEGRTPAVKLSAIKNFLTCNEVNQYTTRERKGWAELDKMLPHVYGKKSQYALSKGGYDGFQVDFNSKIDGVQLMLTVVAAFDYMSEAVTGFDIGFVEDGLMVRNMYRNHLNMMGGRSFIEIESDRFSGNLADDTRQIFEKTCQIITQPTPNDPQKKAPNPKGRFVERLIQELNRLTVNYPGWKGTNITSIDKNRKPNPDYRNGNHVKGFAESAKQIIELISIYNNDVYNREKSRIQTCLENINPEVPTIPRENIALLLNQKTTVTLKSGLISFEHNRRTFEYAFPDFFQHVHRMMKGYKVNVYFDETDMSSVDIFGENDQYIATLGKLTRVVKAKAEQTQEDLGRSAAMRANRDKAVNHFEGMSRKMLEVEASKYGVDISNMSIAEAQEIIAGFKHISAEDLFEEALATTNAKQTKNYYEDRIIRGGETIPVSKKEQKGLDDQRRALAREQAERKGFITSPRPSPRGDGE